LNNPEKVSPSSENLKFIRILVQFSPRLEPMMKFNIRNSVFWRRYFNIDNRYFKIHKISMKLVGLTRRDIFGILYHCFSFGIIFYCEFFGILYIFRHRKNVLEVAEAFGTKLTAFLGTVKMLTFLLRHGEIELLKKKVEELGDGGLHLMFSISSESDCFFEDLPEQIQQIESVNEYDTKISTFYLISGASAGIFYNVRPLFNFIVFTLILHQPFVSEMPMKSEFFYDISKSPAYELTYLAFAFVTFKIAITSVSLIQLKSIKF
jgi:hypothetical protein